jgi:hypothetical protein
VNCGPTTTGTIGDVAAFWRVTTRTVWRWSEDAFNPLAINKNGHSPIITEEAFVAHYVSHHSADKQSAGPGEAEARARREWREHLKIRAEDSEVREQIEQIKVRLSDLERIFGRKEAA